MRVKNPIIEQRADPFVFFHTDGYYYFTASVPEYNRIEVRRSKSLMELADSNEIATVWNKPDTGAFSDLIWAPEIHCINGVWTIYFAAAPNREIKDGAFQHRMYAIVTRDKNPLTAKWSNPVQVDSGLSTFCLDATCFEHNNEWYYVWAQKDAVLPGNSCLYIAKLSSPITLSTQPVLLTAPELAWETQGFLVNEGPAVLKKNGKIYLTYSASATDERYCIGLLTIDGSTNLLEAQNWNKSPEPIFTSDYDNGIFGPGHNSFTTSPDGKVDYMIYHARSYRNIEGDPLWDPNRHARIHRIDWAKDGSPVWGRLENEESIS